MKSYTLRPDTFTLNFNLLAQVADLRLDEGVYGTMYAMSGMAAR